MIHFATIENDKLVLDVGSTRHVITSKKQFLLLLKGDFDVMCSSTIDFPRDATDDEETIKLVKEIFG